MDEIPETCYRNIVDEYVRKVIEVCNGVSNGKELKVECSFGFGCHARLVWAQVEVGVDNVIHEKGEVCQAVDSSY